MLSCLQTWPEPITRVQHLSDAGIRTIPDRYVKNPSDRPISSPDPALKIPAIDMRHLTSPDKSVQIETAALIDRACRDWGFFQLVNHGVVHTQDARRAWRGFFDLPIETKQMFANSPTTYEGYGSRLGVEKGAPLDWSDYFFLHYLPSEIRDDRKLPASCREVVGDYSRQVIELSRNLMRIFSANLGLKEDYLEKAFGGDEPGVCMRVNYYPKCPQPDLTLGLSAHSDPGGMTVLFPDEHVSGLQVRHGDTWVTVEPIPNAFIVNVGDQLQILSNGNYRSVEHRVVVNSEKERVSLALFYNPRGEMVIKPAVELGPPLYPATTFSQYRLQVRTKGLSGKSQVESLKSPPQS